MARHPLLIHLMTLSLLLGDGTVQIELTNRQEVQGEFIGTYMDHVHILRGEKLYYYPCDDIRSITSALGETFNYDCSDNTVTADILFPPELNPMTGEWTQKLPDVFNPDIVQHVAIEETDGVDTVPSTVDIGVIDPRFDEEVSTLEEKDETEKDFIMINGARYVKASPDGEIYQDIIPTATTDEVVFQAQQAAQQMEKKTLHQFLGAGYCTLLGVLGLPASILHVELLANSKMDFGNPFYTSCDSHQRIVYEQYYKKEEKRLRRKSVYGTQGACILMLIGWIVFTEEILSLASD